MNKTKKFIILTFLLLFSRAGDFWTTLMATPDLTREVNPLKSVFGGGWQTLIIYNLLILLFVIGTNYYHLFRFKYKKYENADFTNKRQMLSLMYFDRIDKFKWLFYKTPKNWSVLIHHVGHILPPSLIFLSFVAIVYNFMVWQNFDFAVVIMDFIKNHIYILYLIVVVPLFISIKKILKMDFDYYKKGNYPWLKLYNS